MPPHILLTSQLTDIARKVELVFDWMQVSFKEELSNHLLSHFQINGAVPITYQQVHELVESMGINNQSKINLEQFVNKLVKMILKIKI